MTWALRLWTLLSILRVGLVLGFPVAAYAGGVERPFAKTERLACVIIPLRAEVVVYSSLDPSSPSTEAKAQPDAKLLKVDSLRFLDESGCKQFNDPNRILFRVASDAWFKRADFIAAEQMERIPRWTTRHLYDNWYLRATSSDELQVDHRRATSSAEISAYQVSTIQDHLHLFTRDGFYLDTRNNIRWELRWSPLGALFVLDPSGRFLPVPINLSSSFEPVCMRDTRDGALTCGYQFQRSACREHRNALGACPDAPPDSPRSQPDNEIGRMAIPGRDWETYRFFRDHGVETMQQVLGKDATYQIRADKVIIQQRPGRQGGESLSFYARFDDPVRPVVFAPGVLFRSNAKPRVGKPLKNEVLWKEICLADCSEQLALQGEKQAGK